LTGSTLRLTCAAHAPASAGRIHGRYLVLERAEWGVWRVENVAPEQLISAKHPDKVRVRLADSSSVELQQPRIAADSLRGYDEHAKQNRTVSLADVSSLATRHANWFANGVFIALGAAAIGLVIGIARLIPRARLHIGS